MSIKSFFSKLFTLSSNVEAAPKERYQHLRFRIAVGMFVVTMLPLSVMLVINQHHFQKSLKQETVSQLRALASKSKHSFELFLQERMSAVRYIAHAYSYEQLKDSNRLRDIFFTIQDNFSGFVDLGLISPHGVQTNYIGPYDLEGKDYSETESFHGVQVSGSWISEVFLGFRKFPHIVMAVERRQPSGQNFILRASIDIQTFNEIIGAMGLDPESDAFLINQQGLLQTPSKFYGDILTKVPLDIPTRSLQPVVLEAEDHQGRDIFLTHASLAGQKFVLTIVKPRASFYRSWYALKGQMMLVFAVSVLIITVIIFRLTGHMVRQIREADEKREVAFRELEHSHKLSSIGQMAAGVAHEVNNPLAIINEKTGLMQDLLLAMPELEKRDKFLALADSILQSVERARGITYRLLGFARRLEGSYETLDLNQVLINVIGFVQKEADDRNVSILLDLEEDLEQIVSDQGQLEQVFLNILNNALAAVEDGGRVEIKSWKESSEMVAISIADNGSGMSSETMNQIFEPFFTTKKHFGTGLGLSITYGIIKKLGGEIKVWSQVDAGSQFTIYLPKRQKRIKQ
jgi:two-component system NtrC family sensor kinase